MKLRLLTRNERISGISESSDIPPLFIKQPIPMADRLDSNQGEFLLGLLGGFDSGRDDDLLRSAPLIGEDKEIEILGQKLPLRTAVGRYLGQGSCAGMPCLVLLPA